MNLPHLLHCAERAAAIEFGIDVAAVRGRRRHPEIVRARHAAWCVLHDRCEAPLAAIARAAGNARCHATVRWGVHRARARAAADARYARRLGAIAERLKGDNDRVLGGWLWLRP
jgi:chromosomal replication initiation ATPase DnaA